MMEVEMTQAEQLKEQLESMLVAQGGVLFALCPDGSQLRVEILPATRENLWTEQVLVHAIQAEQEVTLRR
jgi:hypothetical protein